MKKLIYLITLFIVLSSVYGVSIENTPLISGTEYNIRVNGDNTELNWILHLINKGNETLSGLGITFNFEISEFHNNRNLICEKSFVSDSMGQMNEYPLQKKENKYIIPYSGVSGVLEPTNSFNVVNIMDCKGFIIKKDKGYVLGWIFGKVPETEEMVISYEIKKPLFRDIKIVEKFPPTTLITKDTNSISVEWHTQEDSLSPTLTYIYEWDVTTISLMLISLILGIILDRSFGWIKNKIKTISIRISNKSL